MVCRFSFSLPFFPFYPRAVGFVSDDECFLVRDCCRNLVFASLNVFGLLKSRLCIIPYLAAPRRALDPQCEGQAINCTGYHGNHEGECSVCTCHSNGNLLCMQGDVLKKIPDENFRGSDLDLVPIDGVDLPPGSVGEVVN